MFIPNTYELYWNTSRRQPDAAHENGVREVLDARPRRGPREAGPHPRRR
ncbi:MAG: hypothetical protein WKG07_00490 [Hymenobacter sp.]